MTGSSPDPAVSRRAFLGRALGTGLAVLAAPGWAPRALGAEPAGAVRAWRAMGTLIEVRVPDLPRADAVEAVRGVRRRVEELEAAMTLYRAESPLVAMNAAPTGRWVPVPRDLAEGAEQALAAAERTGRAYDPTVAGIMRAWGLDTLEGAVPSDRDRARWRSRPGPGAIEVDGPGERMRRLDDRIELDLGGIGKGIAVDAALAVLEAAGSTSALVNFGGQLGALGAPADDARGWRVGIAHPRKSGAVLAETRLAGGHLATSADAERWYRDAAGARIHHILHPATGDPVREVATVTVRAASGVLADAASTAAFVRLGTGVEGTLPGVGIVHAADVRDGETVRLV